MSGGRKIYVNAATQISLQQPLSDAWMTTPVWCNEPYSRCIDPNFREWLNPLESRRLGKILKRALVTSLKVMRDTGITQPDAIITGTGLGCIEYTELFLDLLCRDGEEMLKPTYFMQSTHNTISSLIAIQQKCHGYNSTYSHRGVSFDSALFDAFIQLRVGDIANALVTANDEMTPVGFKILQRTGYVGLPGQVTASEASMAMILSEESEKALCEIVDMKMSFGQPDTTTWPLHVDAVLVGLSGSEQNDQAYQAIRQRYASLPMLRYKHLFGECYSASGLGIYAAAHLLSQGMAPSFMRCDGKTAALPLNRLLVVNHSDGDNFSYVLMQRFEK